MITKVMDFKLPEKLLSVLHYPLYSPRESEFRLPNDN
jgi:hypothetical protein